MVYGCRNQSGGLQPLPKVPIFFQKLGTFGCPSQKFPSFFKSLELLGGEAPLWVRKQPSPALVATACHRLHQSCGCRLDARVGGVERGACSRKRAVNVFGWVFFLISSGSPHVRPVGRACGEPDENGLTAMGVELNGSGRVPLAPFGYVCSNTTASAYLPRARAHPPGGVW